ncbi:hypothetical protein CEP51_016236, partial [Fusarium floridanum]
MRLLLLAFAHFVGASTVLQLNGTTYYSPDSPEGSVRIEKSSRLDNVLPVTYINEFPSSVQDLQKKVTELLDGDDVISNYFLSTLILPSNVHVSSEVKQYLKSAGTSTFVSTSAGKLPSGPYFLHPSGQLSRVYRLYVDYNMAFVQGVIEGSGGTYLPSTASIGESVNAAI